MKSARTMWLVTAAFAGSMAFAAVRPAAVFSDHAVLLKSADTPVFGFADPGDKVNVLLGGVSAGGTASGSGRTGPRSRAMRSACRRTRSPRRRRCATAGRTTRGSTSTMPTVCRPSRLRRRLPQRRRTGENAGFLETFRSSAGVSGARWRPLRDGWRRRASGRAPRCVPSPCQG